MSKLTQYYFNLLEHSGNSEDCVDLAKEALRSAVDSMYSRKHFNPKNKAAAYNLIVNVKDQFEETLRSAKWMDEKSRVAALDKIKALLINVGYPDELLDDRFMTNLYRNVRVNERNFVESVLSINAFRAENVYASLHIFDRNHWTIMMSPTMVNAGYSPFHNSIRECPTYFY